MNEQMSVDAEASGNAVETGDGMQGIDNQCFDLEESQDYLENRTEKRKFGNLEEVITPKEGKESIILSADTLSGSVKEQRGINTNKVQVVLQPGHEGSFNTILGEMFSKLKPIQSDAKQVIGPRNVKEEHRVFHAEMNQSYTGAANEGGRHGTSVNQSDAGVIKEGSRHSSEPILACKDKYKKQNTQRQVQFPRTEDSSDEEENYKVIHTKHKKHHSLPFFKVDSPHSYNGEGGAKRAVRHSKRDTLLEHVQRGTSLLKKSIFGSQPKVDKDADADVYEVNHRYN